MTDEQLDAEIKHYEAVIRTAPVDASYFYDIDSIKDQLALLQALRAERAAHQATKAELDECRQMLVSIEPRIDQITQRVTAQRAELEAAGRLATAVRGHISVPDYHRSVEMVDALAAYDSARAIKEDTE